jgi:hypothetical protein
VSTINDLLMFKVLQLCNHNEWINSLALVRKRTIQTEQPPLVGEVLVPPFAGKGVAWSAQWIPTAINLGFLDRSRCFFIQVAPQLSSWGWVDPIPDHLLLRKSGRAGDRTRDLWICSQKLWPLDHRGSVKQNLNCLVWFKMYSSCNVAWHYILTQTLFPLESSNFWDIKSCSPLKINWHFRGTCRFHLQGWRINKARAWSSALLPASHSAFLDWLILQPWR